MEKEDIFAQEVEKLTLLFTEVESAKAKLVEGLIQDAAFLFAESHSMRNMMANTGMMKVHPLNVDIQKPTETAKQYLKTTNSYAVIIKTLNGILSKSAIEQEDDFDQFMRQEIAGNVLPR